MANHKFLKYSYWLSVLCLIHCIAFPIAIAILPFFNMFIELNHTFELILISSVFILGSYALIHAYKNHHHNIAPLILFYLGISISVYIHLISHNHSNLNTMLEIFSGIIIASAQFWNIKITPQSCSH